MLEHCTNGYNRHVEEVGNEQPKRAYLPVVCIAIAAATYFITPGLTGEQRIVAAVFAGAVAFWISEAIPIAMTALLATVALIVTGGLSAKDAFAAFGDPIVLLFIGSFLIAKSMELSGLDRRMAFWLLSKPWATRNTGSLLLTMGGISCGISLLVSNTATTVMLLPIGMTILTATGAALRGSSLSTGMLLMLTWGSSIAVGTIVGTPPNVLGVGLIREATGTSINFLQWMAFGMPITVVMLLSAWLCLKPWKGKPTSAREARSFAQEEYSRLGKLRCPEKVTLAGFGVAMTLWIVPGLSEYILGQEAEITRFLVERMPEAVAALLGAATLFLLPCRDLPGGRAMTWRQAATIEWGTILLFAGGLALGKAAFDSGLAKRAGEAFVQATGASDQWMIVAIATLMAIIVSELASNTASANVVVPVAIALAEGANVNVIPVALGAIIGSNLGFMLPISTPPNAVVYSSGLIPARIMIARGAVFDCIGFVVTVGMLRILLPPLGLA